MLISDKRKCNFYNVGYCKNFDKGCIFFHPKESCNSENCDYKTCPKRHQKDCKFFKSKKFCKHGSNCQFKHQTKKTDSTNGDESNEKKELKSKVKHLEETIKNLKTENKKKDSEIKNLHEENSHLNEKIDTMIKANNEKACHICEKKFENVEDLKNHISNDHKTGNSQLIKSKEFIARLQGMCKDFVEEKKKHKNICKIAGKCPHEMSCNRNCYFLDESYVESEPEDSDDDLESEDDETDDHHNDPFKQNIQNKCANCNFEAKSVSGLKIHEKADHKIQCESCDFKTTS
jgi:hypothetical protein